MPILGNFHTVIKKGFVGNDTELIEDMKFCGYFEGSQPVIMTTDLKFMKNFLIKDFNSFANRRVLTFTVLKTRS